MLSSHRSVVFSNQASNHIRTDEGGSHTLCRSERVGVKLVIQLRQGGPETPNKDLQKCAQQGSVVIDMVHV